MPDKPEPVEVVQADREAAARFSDGRRHADGTRAGQFDNNELVQAFARHRLAHAPPPAAPSARDAFGAGGPEVTEDMLEAGQERLCQIRNITTFDDEAQAEIFKAMFNAMPAPREGAVRDKQVFASGYNAAFQQSDDAYDLDGAWATHMNCGAHLYVETATKETRA